MLHPVGSRSASTYWRRRLVVAAVVVLLVLSVYLLFFGGSDSATTSATGSPSPLPTVASGTPSASAPAASTSAAPTTDSSAPASTPASSPASASATTGAPSPAATPSATVTGVVSACQQGSLTITAGSSAPTYALTAQPVLFLQVTDTGPVPCSLDLADAQIELIVYNGASRVWGSHDCAVLPGTSLQTLAVNTPVARSITWSGLASAPGACQNRQHVAAGTYTLHAKLAGVEGATSTFTLT